MSSRGDLEEEIKCIDKNQGKNMKMVKRDEIRGVIVRRLGKSKKNQDLAEAITEEVLLLLYPTTPEAEND